MTYQIPPDILVSEIQSFVDTHDTTEGQYVEFDIENIAIPNTTMTANLSLRIYLQVAVESLEYGGHETVAYADFDRITNYEILDDEHYTDKITVDEKEVNRQLQEVYRHESLCFAEW